MVKKKIEEIKCEICMNNFDSSYDPDRDSRIAGLIKPYVKDLSEIYSLSYKNSDKFHYDFDENKYIQLLSVLQKKYREQFKKYRIKSNYICKSCGHFSVNLYNSLKSIEYRLEELRKINRKQKGIRLEYFGIVFDSKLQLYSCFNDKFQYELDYISKRFIYEKDNPEKKNMYYPSFGHIEAKILYEKCEIFSFNYKNLKFIFAGMFTSEIKNYLIQKTTDYIDYIISHNIVNLSNINIFNIDSLEIEKILADINVFHVNKFEIEKINSYIFILEDIFLFSVVTKTPTLFIDKRLNDIIQKFV